MYYTVDDIICKEQLVKMMNNYFGTNLRYLRHLNNMTQIDLAKKLSTTHQAISNYERSQRFCDLNTLVEISELFNISIDDLLKKKLSDNPRLL